jgi:hypothetical protein
MAITKQELVDIISSQVQTVVMEKVQAFTDGWASEFHKLVVEVKGTEEHNSLIIGKLNDHEAMFVRLRDTTDKVSKLFTMFYENGFSGRFMELQKAFQTFLTTRAETCPLNRRQRQWVPIIVALAAQLPVWIVLFMRLKLV